MISSVPRPMTTAMLTDMPAITISQIAIGKDRTMAISSPAEPSCGQENGVSLPHLFLCAK